MQKNGSEWQTIDVIIDGYQLSCGQFWGARALLRCLFALSSWLGRCPIKLSPGTMPGRSNH
jgi:hypothetical protein